MKNQQPNLSLWLEIEDKDYRAQLETGSGNCFMSRELAYSIRDAKGIPTFTTSYGDARSSWDLESIVLSVRIKRLTRKISQVLIVRDSSYPITIGTNFCKEVGLIINFRDNSISIDRNEVSHDLTREIDAVHASNPTLPNEHPNDENIGKRELSTKNPSPEASFFLLAGGGTNIFEILIIVLKTLRGSKSHGF